MINEIKTAGKGMITLYLLALIGVLLIIYRLFAGLGSITNLSDGYPWGLWIAIDIMTGIAMTTGGLIIAALVVVFNREKYRPLLRPALLTAFLGYMLEMVGLVPDLGRPWMMWKVFFYWNNDSVMFLVGWCVMFQAIVLSTILAPIFFEKLNWSKTLKAYDKIVPWVGIFLISFFLYSISDSIIWGIVSLVVFTLMVFLFRTIIKKDTNLLLFSIIGIIISIAHQTALGGLFILVPEALSGLWYSPLLQINFLLTAFTLGFGMIIFESSISSKVFGFRLETDLMNSISKALPWALLIALVLRFVTLFMQTNFNFGDAGTVGQNISFWIEVFVGLILPMILISFPGKSRSPKMLFYIACMVIFGVIMSRINVTWIGINAIGYANYRPFIPEIMVTAGIFSIGLLVFYYIGKKFPILLEHTT